MERDYTIDYDKKIIDFMNYLEVKFTEESNRIDRYSVRVIKGRRFDRIVYDNNYDFNRIHCFVERDTGNIYKPAGWRAPQHSSSLSRTHAR